MNLKKLFIYVFPAVLSFRCFARVFPSCGELELLFIVCMGFSLR